MIIRFTPWAVHHFAAVSALCQTRTLLASAAAVALSYPEDVDSNVSLSNTGIRLGPLALCCNAKQF